MIISRDIIIIWSYINIEINLFKKECGIKIWNWDGGARSQGLKEASSILTVAVPLSYTAGLQDLYVCYVYTDVHAQKRGGGGELDRH